MNPSLRRQLANRCAGYCDLCGTPLDTQVMAAHHRKLRKQGGEDAIHNLLALHHHCHNLATTSVHLSVAESRKYGWIVSAYQDPQAVPVLLHRRKAVLLTPEGDVQRIDSHCFECASAPCTCEGVSP